jgi:amino acid transporter
MIDIGGTLGTSLFVGLVQAFAIGGPGFLFLAYTLTSLLLYDVVTTVIEVCTYLPVFGSSVAYYGARLTSPSAGSALSWLYVYSFGILMACEITAAAIVIDHWPNNVHIAVWSKSSLYHIQSVN